MLNFQTGRRRAHPFMFIFGDPLFDQILTLLENFHRLRSPPRAPPTAKTIISTICCLKFEDMHRKRKIIIEKMRQEKSFMGT
ncbi:hypothetical protein Y032_1066g3526 [Ancylostoma ceylanicum]|uniref:Uncharacterized protein n=1 Tax=Ancylostoma ceylanicum TaxID=53326 RepID=A0A016W8Q7_9BILA|nr:hypothetical protein Y032_1066g3526 [Ancylostoma ceylanicum]